MKNQKTDSDNRTRLHNATNRASELLSTMPQNLRDETCQKAFEQFSKKNLEK